MSCSTCDRPTYAGCGMHVEQVLGDVPATERCRCADNGSTAGGSWLGRLFAR